MSVTHKALRGRPLLERIPSFQLSGIVSTAQPQPGLSPKDKSQLRQTAGNELAFGELEASSRFAPAVFLAFHDPRVPGQEPALLQIGPQIGLMQGQSF